MADEQEFHFDFQHLQQRAQDLRNETDLPMAAPTSEDGFLFLFGLLLIACALFGVSYLISLGWHAAM